HEIDDRDLVHRASDVHRAPTLDAPAEALKPRASLLVERDDLAVEHDARSGERAHPADDLGVARAARAPAPVAQRDVGPPAHSDDAHAVELELVEPLRIVEARARERGQHRLLVRHAHVALGSAERRRALFEATGQLPALRELVHLEARVDAPSLLGSDVGALLRERVLLLEEQPLVVTAPRLHEGEAAAQLEPVQDEVDLAALDAGLGRALEVADPTDVPRDHRPGAVVPLRDDLLELEVLERMIFGVHGEAPFPRIEARPARHREALQRPPHLNAEVVVRAACLVEMHDEPPAQSPSRRTVLPFRGERFVGPARVALRSIVGERIVPRRFRGFGGAVRLSGRHPRSVVAAGRACARDSTFRAKRTRKFTAPNGMPYHSGVAPRALSTATISFGLVSIPVKLFTAASSEQVSFNMLHKKCGGRVKMQFHCPTDNEVVERADTVKGYEYARGQYVLFSDEEIKALEAARDNAIEITEFVPIDTVDFVHVEKSYYLGPDKGGDKAYRLLSAAMQGKDRVAVGRWAARGKEQLVLVRPYGEGLILHQLYYKNEVRS